MTAIKNIRNNLTDGVGTRSPMDAPAPRDGGLEDAAQLVEQNIADFYAGGNFITMSALPGAIRALKNKGE